jgi:serine phosphatase RsbU (regulator of sigma subunit)
MGHGVAAALYTTYLRALWDRHQSLLTTPSLFATTINAEINHAFPHGETFMAGLCGMVDLGRDEVLVTGAGNPPALCVHSNGDFEQ